jgi:uncharacterized membrane protein
VQLDVVSETVIHRPVDEVAAYAADPTNAPSWYGHIDSVEWVTEPGVRVGARAAYLARFLGKHLAYTYEIAEHEPGARLVMRTTEGPFPMETAYTWEAVPDGTRMTLRIQADPSGFSKLVTPFIAGNAKRAIDDDLASLRAMLEAR